MKSVVRSGGRVRLRKGDRRSKRSSEQTDAWWSTPQRNKQGVTPGTVFAPGDSQVVSDLLHHYSARSIWWWVVVVGDDDDNDGGIDDDETDDDEGGDNGQRPRCCFRRSLGG